MALVCSLHVPSTSFITIINPNHTISPKFSIDQKARRSVPQFSLHFRSLVKAGDRSFGGLLIKPVDAKQNWIYDMKRSRMRCVQCSIVNESGKESDPSSSQGDDNEDLGVKVALSMLKFYKNEISPLLPKSCRYVPTCSEYSMIAYKKYGSVKGSILTVWRICRCNPLGGSGFDPPRWFDEPSPPEE